MHCAVKPLVMLWLKHVTVYRLHRSELTTHPVIRPTRVWVSSVSTLNPITLSFFCGRQVSPFANIDEHGSQLVLRPR